MSNILSQRAMLARLTISQWSARKLDKKVTDQINRDHNASADAGRYNKLLVSKDAIAALQSIAGAARVEHMNRTLPWQDSGARILSSVGFDDYAKAMQNHRYNFEAAVEKFCNGYPDFVTDARTRLNGLFSESDYPAASDIRAKFRFAYNFDPCPTANDFRVNMSDAQADMIRADIESRSQIALQEAMRDVWQRIATLVGHMAAKLRAYKPGTETDRAQGTFHDSLVENIRELIGALPSLNITNDPALTQLAVKMESELCSESADNLREFAITRESVAIAAESILADVNDYLA